MGALLVLPWLTPWSPAPQPNTVPWLLSWACVGLLLVGGQQVRPLDIARAWACAALISSVLGLIQYFGAASALYPWLHITGLGEANANLRQRNQLATLLGMGLMAVLCWQAHGLKTRQALWMLALLGTGLAATRSRTGLLHMLLITVLTAFWAHRSRWQGLRYSPRLALWALAFYWLASWGLPWFLGVLTEHVTLSALIRLGDDEGCRSRRVLWANVLHLIAQKPWTGWGWDALKYAHYITPYAGAPEVRFCDVLGNAHNLPLHLAVTLGIPIAAALVLAVLAVLAWARPWGQTEPTVQLAWSVLALIGVHSLLEFPLWYGPFQMAVLLCALLLRKRAPLGAPRPSRHVQLAGGLVLAMAALLASDYARVRQIYVPAHQRWPAWRDDPLGAARSSWFFKSSATFAELSLTRLTPENAPWVLTTSQAMLHFSPEPMVVRALIVSAQLLERHDLVALHSARWRAAFASEPPLEP